MRALPILALTVVLVTGVGGVDTAKEVTPGPTYKRPTLKTLYHSTTFYGDYVDYINDLVAEFEDTGIVRLTSLGKSVQGRDILDISIGDEKASTMVTINATHHPDECINTMLVLNQIEYILQLYRDGGEYGGVNVRQLLSKAEIHFIPLVNPDGLEAYNAYLQTGALEKGFSATDLAAGVNANNVNLNRNYDAKFRPKSQNSGSHPFSEPETQAMKGLHDRIDFDYSIAYHSTGDLIFWNYGQTGSFYDETLQLARLLKKETGYALDMQPATRSRYIGGTADFGGYKDWLVVNGHPAATIETSPPRAKDGKVPWRQFEDIWVRNKDVPLSLVSHFYRQKNRLIEWNLVTASLCVSGTLFPDELILYEGRSYIEEPLFKGLLGGGDTDGVIAGKRGQRVVMDITDQDQFVMIDSVRYRHIRALAGDGYLVRWDGDERTVYVTNPPAGAVDR